MKQLFPGIYSKNGRLYTLNSVKGFRVHGEHSVREGGKEYREWNARQSKLAAAIVKGLKELPIKEGSNVLYLGAAQGATPSFVSDIIGPKGLVYCVEFASRAMQDLLPVCEKHENMLPILADARLPEKYAKDVGEVDVIFEDVADPQQTLILEHNAKLLKKGGCALIAIKSQCISSTKPKAQVYEQVKKEVAQHFEIVESLELDPLEKDHLFLSLKKK